MYLQRLHQSYQSTEHNKYIPYLQLFWYKYHIVDCSNAQLKRIIISKYYMAIDSMKHEVKCKWWNHNFSFHFLLMINFHVTGTGNSGARRLCRKTEARNKNNDVYELYQYVYNSINLLRLILSIYLSIEYLPTF